MEYPIYTYGGGDLLISVFNAVAMIFKSDSTYLTPVGKMAMTLGGVYIGIKATFKGNITMISNWMIPSMIAFIFLFSPKTTIWIKDEVALNAPVKIDNIPFGLSFFTSLSSTLSHRLSQLLEEVLLPVSSSGSSQGGILYGAKAVAKLRDVQIQDPILLHNVKEYTRQCYMKPYILGNFGGLKAAASRATDILAFLETHPAKCFGIIPMTSTGPGKFATCSDAGKIIKREVEAHSKDPLLLKKFAATIGMSTSNQALMNQRIKAMTSDTLQYLDQQQQDIHEWMKQSMVLNANRESYDDWREKVGNARVFPELVKMQATRGMFHQAFSSIISAEMAESMIPATAQPVMLALVVMIFVIILPFAMLPGGWQYIVTGSKLMIWVCSWPVFYTIIHAIAMIQLKDAVAGWGEDGLSVIGQGGFTELILWKYASVQSLVTSVPIISFAIVFGSPYALSSIAGSVASTSSAGSIGASMADGNMSMGQRSYNTLTRDQENHSPSLTMGGGVIDDGSMRVQSDSSGGQIITEYGDQLLANNNVAEVTTTNMQTSLSNAQTNMASLTDRESSMASIVNSENIDVARSIAHGTTKANNLTISDTEALRKGFSVDEATTKLDSTSENKTTGTNSHLGLNIPGGVLTGVSGGTGTTASNNEDVRKDMSIQERQAFNTALDKVKTAAKTDSLTSNSSEDIRRNQSYASNLSKQEQIGKEKAKTQQDIDTYSNQISYLEQNSGTINRNCNDQVMREIMHRHPELRSKEQVSRWQRTHQEEANDIARSVINSINPLAGIPTSFNAASAKRKAQEMEQNIPTVQDTEIATVDSLKQKHKQNDANIKKQAVVKNATGGQESLEEVVKNDIEKSNPGYNQSTKEILENSFTPEDKKTMEKIKKGKDNYKKVKAEVKEAKENTNKSTGGRVVIDLAKGAENAVNYVAGNKQDKEKKK